MANYWREEEFKELLLNKEKNMTKIIKRIDVLINAVINKYAYYKFHEVDDLRQHARLNVLSALEKYDPEKGRSFSYFTKVINWALLGFTTKNSKIKEAEVDLENAEQLEAPDINNDITQYERLEELLVETTQDEELSALFANYYRTNHDTASLSEFIIYGQANGFSVFELEEFLNQIKSVFYRN